MNTTESDHGRRHTGLLLILGLLLLARPAAVQPPALSRFVDDYAATHDFHGTVAVQHKGALQYLHSYGLSNRQFNVPNRDDTKYKIASITKMFTAVLILQLRDQGRLNLDATIRTYLPGYAGEAGARTTIHQLLTHTSGMANADKDASPATGLPHYQTPMTTDELVKRYYSAPLAAEPGKVFDYNNADYIILGKIVEAVHGRPFDAVLAEHILGPLNMAMSGMLRQPVVLPQLADTYFYRDDLKALCNDLPVYMENWYASGGMYSTAADLLTFSRALFNNTLVSPEAVRMMTHPGLDDYGYGVWVDDITIRGATIKAVRRPGRIMGAQTMLLHYLDTDLTIVVLSNAGTTSPDDFAFAIGRRILGR